MRDQVGNLQSVCCIVGKISVYQDYLSYIRRATCVVIERIVASIIDEYVLLADLRKSLVVSAILADFENARWQV